MGDGTENKCILSKHSGTNDVREVTCSANITTGLLTISVSSNIDQEYEDEALGIGNVG